MLVFKPIPILAAALCFASRSAFPQGDVQVEWDEQTEEEQSTIGVERIFKNPALASGLQTGTAAINRSVDSLMESLFYSLLDNELVYDITDQSQFTLALNRDLHTTSDGSYVVVDRFALGPKFNHLLTKIVDIPVSLGAQSSINVLNIYLRTDGMRLAENEELPFWRVALNNMLGLIPILTNILPPSFNPNEMYDPTTYVSTPFIFPNKPENVYQMPIGSIRSYSVSGGIQLPIDIMGYEDSKYGTNVFGIDGFRAILPYTIFKTGEHRISVLRRDEHIAWVGLTDLDQYGHGIAAGLGKTYYVFAKLVPFWTGMPAAFFPIDANARQTDTMKYDRLYEFDLRKADAAIAYEKAVKGDFTTAHEMYLTKNKFGKETGVHFHFTRKETGLSYNTGTSRNLFLFRSSRDARSGSAEVETVDGDGPFYTLETQRQVEDENWDVLVGSEEHVYNTRVDMNVERIPMPGGDFRYVFSSNDRNPTSLMLSLNIQDRFLDAAEFRSYIQLLKFFTLLPMNGLPDIPIRAPEDKRIDRMTTALADPSKDVFNLHVTPTHLGKFTANASIYFDTKNINTIANQPTTTMWTEFATAFGLDPSTWQSAQARGSYRNHLRRAGAAVTYPLRVLDVRINKLDAINEAERCIEALEKLRDANTPLTQQKLFDQLLATDHPAQIARALLKLSDMERAPRSISLSAKRVGKGSETSKAMFQSLDRRVYQTKVKFPPPQRYRIAREKLLAFSPRELRERRKKPQLIKISISTKPVEVKKDVEDKDSGNETTIVSKESHIFVSIDAKGIQPDGPSKLYVRLEQGGKLNVGRFVLGERVVRYEPLTKTGTDSARFGFFITGPLSPFKGFLFENIVSLGGLFDLNIGISSTGEVWSEERKIGFRFENGKLFKPR